MRLFDLGNLVKNKYKEYVSVPTVELGKMVAKKYPEYGEKLTDATEKASISIGKTFQEGGERIANTKSTLPGMQGRFANLLTSSAGNEVSELGRAVENVGTKEGREKLAQGRKDFGSQGVIDKLNNPNTEVAFAAMNFMPGIGMVDDVGDTVRRLPFKNFSDLSLKSFKHLEGRGIVNKQFIQDLTNKGDIKQPERDLMRKVLDQFDEGKVSVQEFADRVKTELLPLDTKGFGNSKMKTKMGGSYIDTLPQPPKYESITLPDELRGNVANYGERVYTSPIKTSAGDIHFGGDIDNYFGHTRIEDMADSAYKISEGISVPGAETLRSFESGKPMGTTGNTRRVIELQSDLFQKGRLDYEFKDSPAMGDVRSNRITRAYDDIFDKTGKKGIEAVGEAEDLVNKQHNQLSPYRNTWHERLIKEEVKQAGLDGKTKLQFPTGETAMKIEGLGESSYWSAVLPEGNIQRLAGGDRAGAELFVGREIVQNTDTGNAWIITDVLDDGKFKAVPKNTIGNLDIALEEEGVEYLSEEYFNQVRKRTSLDVEQFDISGKIDTKNPIYRFYEKDIQKYLKKNYSAKTIIDPQGVSWFELDISPKQSRMPIEAFSAIPIAGAGAYGMNQMSQQQEQKPGLNL